MRLKFTYQRPGGDTTDLIAELESVATIGDLARHLALADPALPMGPDDAADGSFTLATTGTRGRLLDPRELVAGSELASGGVVALARSGHDFTSVRPDNAAVRVRALTGVDQGREFLLAAGTAVIGRERSCEVQLNDPLASRQHAVLNIGESIEVIDQASANGIMVGLAVRPRATLSSGDVITVGDTQLEVTRLQQVGRTTGTVEFVRPARVVPTYEGREIDAPVPPERPRPQRFPTVALIAPIIMGGVLYLVTENIASLLFVALSPLMLIGSAMESRIVGRREFRDAVAAFDADLTAMVDDIRDELGREVEARLTEHPSASDCVVAATGHTPALWARRPDLTGFGELRLGVGRTSSRTTVTMPTRNKAPFEQVQKLERAIADVAEVDGVPVVADLDDAALGVVGPRASLLSAARSLVVQAVTLHSPAELVVTGLFGAESAPDWDWMKWLPHVGSPHSPVAARPLTATQTPSAALVAGLESLIEERREQPDQTLPRVLVVVESGALVEHSRLVAIAECGPSLGIQVVWLAPSAEQLPAACKVFLETSPIALDGRVGYVSEGKEVLPVLLDTIDAETARRVASALAPVADAGARNIDSSDLPRSIAQFTVLKDTRLGSRPESVLERWQESGSILTGPYAPAEPAKRAGTLRAVVGQSVDGAHALDLRTDGPHALVGGTTNSGKSELLQSWILSLAAAHSPERVTFLLVDYKGGSAFADCEHLPHVIGQVTDLTQHMVRRALTSLKAEVRYREELLQEHGAKDLVELEKHGVAGAPPSLIIVVDEFAALISDVPEFVEGVINVAQRGRSLGLHLILATQQPSGVIKGALRANTNLRIALRTADADDSTDVVGTPDAASFELDVPGRAMSRSGPRRVVPFQTAFAGGWTSEEPESSEVVIEELTLNDAHVWELPDSARPVAKDRSTTDIKRLVNTIREANLRAGLPEPRKPWLSMLPAAVDLGLLPRTRRDDVLVFAQGDDPDNQTQPPVSFAPDREGNLVVYGTGGAGKSTLLRSIAISAGLSQRGGPCHVYGLDFGSRALSMLEVLPHVGSIIPGADHERVARLLTWLRQLIDERAARYSGGSSNAATIAEYRQASGSQEPRILVLLDGIAAFRQAYETTDRVRYLDLLTSIASEGRPVGVHLVISAADRTGLYTALASAVQRRILLRMASVDDYSLLGAPTDVLSATSVPGRGLDGELEIQVGILGLERDDASQAQEIEALATALREVGVAEAPPIRSLPDDVQLEELVRPVEEVPLGLAAATLGPIGVDARGGFLVTGPPGSGRSTALRTLVVSAAEQLPAAELHYFGNRRSELAAWPGWTSASTSVEEIAAAADRIAKTIGERGLDGPRVIVVAESAGDLVTSSAENSLKALVRACLAEEQWFIAEGEVSTVKTTQGFLAMVRSSRRGLALQPDQESGTGLFNTAFPRINLNDYPVGRGLLVGAGRAGVVQVAHSRHLDG